MVRGKKDHEKEDKDQMLKGYIMLYYFFFPLGASLAQTAM